MFANILLASDGSECALRAAVAASLTRSFAARLTLINVFQPFPSIDAYTENVYAGLDERRVTESQEPALSDAGRVANAMGVASVCRRKIGHPADVIVRVAGDEGCDLIVLGSRGLSGVGSFLLGSVCDRVAHHAHCPVLIVK